MLRWNALNLVARCPHCGSVLEISPSLEQDDYSPVSADIDAERLITTAVGLVMVIQCTQAPSCDYRIVYRGIWGCDAEGSRLLTADAPDKTTGQRLTSPLPRPLSSITGLHVFEGPEGRRAVVFRTLSALSIIPTLRVRYEKHPDHYHPRSAWFGGKVFRDSDSTDEGLVRTRAYNWAEYGTLPDELI